MNDALSDPLAVTTGTHVFGDRDAARLAVRSLAWAALAVALALAQGGHRSLDYAVLHALNAPGVRSPLLAQAADALTRDVFSTVLLVALVVASWFHAEVWETRGRILAGVAATVVATISSRALQLAVPSHLRPLHDPALGFVLLPGENPITLNHWASFPSDHAALFFGLAATVFFVRGRLGLAAFALATLLLLPRLYLGYHFPSDLLGGAALGYIAVDLAQGLRHSRLIRGVLALEQRRPSRFYGVALVLAFNVATLFFDTREVATSLVHVFHPGRFHAGP